MPLMRFGSREGDQDADARAASRMIVRRAGAARDAKRYADAAVLYAEALRVRPAQAGIHVQCAHMLKEVGDTAAAEEHYIEARRLMPDDADLELQLGHLYKSTGRLALAEASYARAGKLKPDLDMPRLELARLRDAGWRPPSVLPENDRVAADLALASKGDALAPDIAPRAPSALLHPHGESIEIRRLGRRERTHWGIERTLRGVEAIRGFVISATPLLDVQLLINGQLIHRGAPKGGYPLRNERDDQRLRKYTFNIWLDFSAFVHGRYEIEFRAIDVKQKSRSRHERIVISAPLSEVDNPTCDGVVAVSAGDARTIEQQVNTRPSMVRSAKRALFDSPPRTILVQRVDQLGDLVVSIPALRRLRQILPGARIVGLLSPANAELAATLALFDEILIVDFPDDRLERRRVMPIAEQQTLRERLASYRFDMAIDLAENASSRPLLLLSGAPFLFGFPCGEMPGLNVEVAGFTHDRVDGHEIVPHTNKLMGLIDWLGAMIQNHSQVVRREELGWDRLAAYGILERDRFAVLHDGARLEFSRWAHYGDLAEMILQHTDLRVVMLTDSPATRATLAEAVAGSSRFQLIDHRIPFDDFDALLSHCSVFVGNDSGPKHLASLRGAKVVSIHMARNNWNEWGQENGGVIISRRVPCAGCLIWHDPEECGKDFVCMTQIKPDEVFRAVMRLL